MKKALSKVLARMAKDGDIETVAEIIGEMIEPEETEAPAAQPAPETVPDECAAPEEPEAETADEEGLAAVIERLDRIIALLQPAAADEDPAPEAEEVAEAVLEAVAEAGQENAGTAAGEISAAIEEILEPDV